MSDGALFKWENAMFPGLSRFRVAISVVFSAALLLLGADQAHAAGYPQTFIITPVLQTGGQNSLHLETNLSHDSGIALEVFGVAEHEELTKDEIDETGDTMMTKGRGAVLLVSRYSNQVGLGGFYWAMGIGYREQSIKWQATPDEFDEDIDYTLADEETGKLIHEAKVSGMTGHGRLGYRYLADSWPLLAGFYLGARHFQSGVKDLSDEEEDQERTLATMTYGEKARVKRRFMTRPEIGVELGFKW